MEKEKMLKFNLQLFADSNGEGNEGNEGGGTNNDPQPKTYSEDEYNKLKSLLDKVNAENKKYKDEKKAQMTEEEKRKVEDEARAKEFEQMKLELNKNKLSSELAKGGFDDSQIELISNQLFSEKFDYSEFGKMLSKIKSDLAKSIEKEVQDKFSKSGYTPDGGSGNKNDDKVKEYAQSYGKNNFAKPTREFGK